MRPADGDENRARLLLACKGNLPWSSSNTLHVRKVNNPKMNNANGGLAHIASARNRRLE
jgi:hypothetical protein